MKILVLNSGSSSIKYQFYDMPREVVLAKGSIEKIGEVGSNIRDHQTGLGFILHSVKNVNAVGHRVVHGGEDFTKPTLISPSVTKRIESYVKLAPLHNPPNLEGIYACNKLLRNVPQVAVFDTAFHQTIPEYAYLYGLPFEYYSRFKIRKYGFHGTSHHYVSVQAAKILKRPLRKLKLIVCHLGNGCSITAVKNGCSVDTSMGFTPLEGVLMGTRTGDMDPAVVTFLERRLRISPEQVDNILNKKSGLLGLSGISNDIRKISSAAKRGNIRAKIAQEVFIYRIKKYIGAYVCILNGVDAIIFTAGIGENKKDFRDRITNGLHLFLKRPPKIMVIHTNEELMIARQTHELLTKRRFH